MKINDENYQKGFIKTILIIVVALIILGYFGYNLRDIINSPTVQDNLSFGKEVSIKVWQSFLRVPILFLWNIIISLIGKSVTK
jgi:hypothetical protein